MPLFIKKDDKRYKKFLAHEKKHGWSPDELWSLDVAMAKWFVPRLKGFRDRVDGELTPGCFETNEEWIDILNQMIQAFEIIASEEAISIIDSDNENDVIHNGLDLFREYFFCLWY